MKFNNNIDFSVEGQADMAIKADRLRLNIILSNIFSNSIKYQDPKKQCPYIKVSLTDLDNSWEIAIEDNGIGIEDVHQPKVFDMFYRASEGSDGSGLGLFIVRETIKKLGWTVILTSLIGKGTTIFVGIPKNAPAT